MRFRGLVQRAGHAGESGIRYAFGFALAFFFRLFRASDALRRIRLRSSGETPSHRALPPFFPPFRPSATA
jgi:hypothetical protein